MNTLDRLKELNAGNEWDFNDLGFLVNALPALIAVAEAAKRYVDDDSQESARLYADVVVALAKLEVEQNV